MEEIPESRSHESEDQLELYALDRLTGTDLMRVEDHLIVCSTCRERLEETAAFAFSVRDAFRESPELVPVKRTTQQSAGSWLRSFIPPSFEITWKPHFAMAAFAVIIIATGAYFMATKRDAGRMLAPVASLQLSAMRGEMQDIPASKELDLTLTDSPASGAPFRIELVNETGGVQWTGPAVPVQNGLSTHIAKAVPPGVYFARLYDASGKLLHEYGIRAIRQ